MRIAQVAPLIESVPPQAYGGTERVVADLTNALVRQGHHVTLFASGDSRTDAELVACAPRSLRLDDSVVDAYAHQMLMIERVVAMADEFDVIHWHIDYFHFPTSRCLDLPSVTTLHGRLDIPDLQPMYTEFSEMPVVSISNDQRIPLPQANYVATVHHGLPPGEVTPRYEPGEYLAFLGRISPEKRADRAIGAARRAGLPLKIAAKVDDADTEYYERKIQPLIEGTDDVEFVGEIGGQEKADFLAHASALLFPIDWSEPFGLVMIESMACGTPVIAYPSGSVPEVITEGVNGFMVDSIDAMVAAVGRLGEISREGVRRSFEERFTADRMARDYVGVYEGLLATRAARARRSSPTVTMRVPTVADSSMTQLAGETQGP